MPDSEKIIDEASAEKAYATASEAVSPVKDEPEAAIAIPSVKPKAAPKPRSAPKAKAPVKRKVAAKPKAAPKPAVAAKPKVAVASKPKVAPKPKPLAAKPVAAKKPAPVAAKQVTAAPKSIPSLPTTAIAKTKDMTMSIKDKITGGFDTVMTEAQAKAKEAFEKSSALFGGAAEFTKGNVEAVVESGKILAEGLQDMGTNLVAEGRSAFEAYSADMKDMAAAKSPTDLIQLQSEMFRKNFDSAIAYGSKNTEAMIKITSEAMAPISGRVSLAVEKVRKLAA